MQLLINRHASGALAEEKKILSESLFLMEKRGRGKIRYSTDFYDRLTRVFTIGRVIVDDTDR